MAWHIFASCHKFTTSDVKMDFEYLKVRFSTQYFTNSKLRSLQVCFVPQHSMVTCCWWQRTVCVELVAGVMWWKKEVCLTLAHTTCCHTADRWSVSCHRDRSINYTPQQPVGSILLASWQPHRYVGVVSLVLLEMWREGIIIGMDFCHSTLSSHGCGRKQTLVSQILA